MDGSDLRLYPLFDTATGDMLIRPFYPNTPTPHYISLDQVAAFVGAGSPGPPGPEGPAGPPGPGGGSGGAITLTGDVTGSGTGSLVTEIAANAVGTAEIANSTVTYAKVQSVSGARLLGNPTGVSASPSEISLGTNLSFVGNVLNATGGGGGLSGMTVGQIPIAASATAVASSANLSGDVSSNAALVTTLASVNGDVGTWQGLTVDAKGRVTAAVNQGYLTSTIASSTYAPIASPALTGTPTAPTAGAGTNSTQIATTAFVQASFAPIGSPTFTGDPKAPTPLTADNDTSIATTAFVKAQGYQTGNSTITLSGDVSGSGTSAITVTIGAGAVTYSNVQNVTAARLLGNPTGSSAAPSEITLGTNLSFAGNVLNAAGGGTTPTITTKTTNYTVTAGDLGNTLIMGGGTVTLTLPAGIFTPGKTLTIAVTSTTSCGITNSTGLSMVGLASVILPPGAAGMFAANADGTSLNFIPYTQYPTVTAIGGAIAKSATTNFFLTGLNSQGAFTSAQPSFANLSGTATVAQGGTGATTAAAAATNLSVLPLSGGTISGSLTVSAAIGAVNISVTGATSSVSVEDQTAPGTAWLQYASSGSMRLWRAGDQLTISNAGNLTIAGGTATKVGGGSWVAPSDARLKREITEYKSGLEQVLALKPIEYKYNGLGNLPDDGRSYVGLDAGETQLVMPELVGSMMVSFDPQPQGDLPLVTPPDTEIKTIDPSALIYALVNSCKELAARVAALEDMLMDDRR